MIGKGNWSGMASEPLDQADLIVPTESAGGVLGELDVVGRIRIDEVMLLEAETFKIPELKGPVRKGLSIVVKVSLVVDFGVATKGNVEES